MICSSFEFELLIFGTCVSNVEVREKCVSFDSSSVVLVFNLCRFKKDSVAKF